MPTVNVQFSDSSQTTVVAYFGSPQDLSVYKNLGTVGADDPRWKAYYDGQAPLMQAGLPVPTTP